MAKPSEGSLRDFYKLNEGDVTTNGKSFIDSTLDKIANKTSKDLLVGTVTGWITGFTVVKVGKVAAFGLGARPSQPVTTLPSVPEPEKTPSKPITPPKPPELFRPEEPNIFLEKPAFLPPKPVPHSPKISPSSIPNPNPSVTTNKQMEPGYPNYGGYLYSIPGYSAFQPISYPGIMQPSQAPLPQTDTTNPEFIPFPSIPKETAVEEKSKEVKATVNDQPKLDPPKQMDFEEQFTPEIIPAANSIQDSNKNQVNESKMSITSLAQGSGATVTIPSSKETSKKKTPERFSLKTSIPISKIDMKCVSNPTESIIQNPLVKKAPTPTPVNTTFSNQKSDNAGRVEIQSNIVIKSAAKETEAKTDKQAAPSNNINTLINAAEAINKTDNQFRKPELKEEVINEIKDPPPFTPPVTSSSRSMFNPINIDSSKINFSNKPPDGTYNEQKNQILFIQNKNPSNSKMLLTIQQQNPQVLLQRTTFDPKNLQAPSRLSSQSKKCKDDLVENGTSSKVVALKRLHQENCDENDFENLITENQIYGNKIVVKEKSQGSVQEQDLKNKNKVIEKPNQTETKNVVLQPNFLYLSNVQFPANLMMIKNNAKVNQTTEPNKITKIIPNENKATSEVSTMTNSNDVKTAINNTKTQSLTVSKEIHVLKSSNNVLSNKTSKPDLVFQTQHQKVIMNPQIVYQVPMIVDTDNKLNQPFVNREYPKFISQNKKEYPKQFEQPKSNDKLFIACPYQMDSKLQPKIVITNIRHKIAKLDEVSSLDIYEKKKRMRRLKYLSNRETRDYQKVEAKKVQDKIDSYRNVITPDKMKAEIYKEFANTKVTIEEGSSESDSDYEEEELEEYRSIINEFGISQENEKGKAEFLANNFRLATREAYKEKELQRQESMLTRDAVASAYISIGRIDRLITEDNIAESKPESLDPSPMVVETGEEVKENGITLQKKQLFFSQLKLLQVTTQYREDYEKTWQEILKERKRRNGKIDHVKPTKGTKQLDLDPNGQLQILTEIKKCVTDNNNLIKKRLDSTDENTNEGDSIHILAEKNFSELNRLSKMADRSVKLITGQDARKRDLNPGFDSENIQKPKIQPFQQFINIPNLSKIISLKSRESPMTSAVTSSQATSMDEPQNSAAGVREMFIGTTEEKKEFGCQVEETVSWPGLEAIVKSYREFEAARKREVADLHRRNTWLRVQCAHVTRAASQQAECARALAAERRHLAADERAASVSIKNLCRAIEVIRNCT